MRDKWSQGRNLYKTLTKVTNSITYTLVQSENILPTKKIYLEAN